MNYLKIRTITVKPEGSHYVVECKVWGKPNTYWIDGEGGFSHRQVYFSTSAIALDVATETANQTNVMRTLAPAQLKPIKVKLVTKHRALWVDPVEYKRIEQESISEAIELDDTVKWFPEMVYDGLQAPHTATPEVVKYLRKQGWLDKHGLTMDGYQELNRQLKNKLEA